MAIQKDDKVLYTEREIASKLTDRSSRGWGNYGYSPTREDVARVANLDSRTLQTIAAQSIAANPVGYVPIEIVIAVGAYTDKLATSLGLRSQSDDRSDVIWRLLVRPIKNDGGLSDATVIAEGVSDYSWLLDVRDAVNSLGASMKLDRNNLTVDSEAEDMMGFVDIMPAGAEVYETIIYV